MPDTTRNLRVFVYEFNVGGKLFYFSKDTLELGHNKGSVFEKIMHGVHVKKTPFLDLDPELFRKFCAPYVRHELLPISCDFSSVTEQKHLMAAARSIGLERLGSFIENEMINRSFHVKVKLPLKSQSLQVTRDILMQSTDTIAEFRAKLNKLIADSPEPQLKDLPDDKRFLFEGFTLSEDKTLEYYEIGPFSEIGLE